MSAVIKTTTPFAVESVLMAALRKAGADPVLVTKSMLPGLTQRNRIIEGDILTNREDFNGLQFFRKQRDRWVLMHDLDEYNGRLTSTLSNKRYMPVAEFLNDLGKHYNEAYKQHLEALAEQERIRMEEERKARVEATRQNAIAKAKAQGYSVKETRNGDQIQLVLTRTV